MQSSKPKLSRRGKAAWNRRKDGDDFGDFIVSQPTEVAEEILLFETFEPRRQLLLDLANLRDESPSWFEKRYGRVLWPESDKDIFELRNELRRVWLADPKWSADPILNKWLNWRPSPEHWRKYKKISVDFGEDLLQVKEPKEYLPFLCSIESSKLVPNDFRQLRSMLIQGVLEHWRSFKYCANPNCLTPYFMAKRKDQSVCDAEVCKAEKQRQHALKWWQENRAAGRSKTKLQKTLKRRDKDGAQKTR